MWYKLINIFSEDRLVGRGGFVLRANSAAPQRRRRSLSERSLAVKRTILTGLRIKKQHSTGDIHQRVTSMTGWKQREPSLASRVCLLTTPSFAGQSVVLLLYVTFYYYYLFIYVYTLVNMFVKLTCKTNSMSMAVYGFLCAYLVIRLCVWEAWGLK